MASYTFNRGTKVVLSRETSKHSEKSSDKRSVATITSRLNSAALFLVGYFYILK